VRTSYERQKLLERFDSHAADDLAASAQQQHPTAGRSGRKREPLRLTSVFLVNFETMLAARRFALGTEKTG
jgi:hypothetical protein